jgi:hypothetical protein
VQSGDAVDAAKQAVATQRQSCAAATLHHPRTWREAASDQLSIDDEQLSLSDCVCFGVKHQKHQTNLPFFARVWERGTHGNSCEGEPSPAPFPPRQPLQYSCTCRRRVNECAFVSDVRALVATEVAVCNDRQPPDRRLHTLATHDTPVTRQKPTAHTYLTS